MILCSIDVTDGDELSAITNIFGGELSQSGFRVSVNHGFNANVHSALSTKCVGWSGSFRTPGPFHHAIVSSEWRLRGCVFPDGAVEIHDDDNQCGVHANDLVAHDANDLQHIIPGRVAGNVEVYDNLAELKCRT